MLITLALLHKEKGRGSIPPTHARQRHADKVNTTMPVPTPCIQENICGLGQPRTAPGNKGIVTIEAPAGGYSQGSATLSDGAAKSYTSGGRRGTGGRGQ